MELKTNSRERANAQRTPVTVGALAVIADELGALAMKAAAAGRATVNSLSPGRDRNPHGREPATSNGPQAFEILEKRRYVRLTTYRKNGETVGSPVRFVLIDDRLYVTIPPRSAKMKWIRNDPRVLLVPCNARGVPLGASIEGVARIVQDTAPEHARTALRHRYRLELALFRLLGQHDVGQIRLKIRPAVTAFDPPVSRFSS